LRKFKSRGWKDEMLISDRFGLYGEADHVPVYCHAGGNGQDDFVCDQIAALSVTIISA